MKTTNSMMPTYRVQGEVIPCYFYGTAWKEDNTERLTLEALQAGFRGIDTANQRKHYYEEGVGKGLQAFLKNSSVSRDELFIQTKYTYRPGQDDRLPYDENASFTDQVNQSFESSLKHLGVSEINSYVLHGPYHGEGVGEEDREVWKAMEKIQLRGGAHLIGVSNISLPQLEELYGLAEVKPAFVQNRCYARTGWDYEVRKFCREKGILYQGFSLLTANVQEVMSEAVQEIAQSYSKSIPQVVFRFCHQVGMVMLTGTTSRQNMNIDLDIFDFELAPDQIEAIEKINFGSD